MDQGRSLGSARRMLDALTFAAFIAVIAAPTVDSEIRPDSARSPEACELRRPAPEPELPGSAAALTEYPAKYDAYFKDSFGLRDVLLRWNSIVKVFGFGVSPSELAFFGKQGWLFYTGQHTRENHRGRYPFATAELERWSQALACKRTLLESMGIRYVFVLAPDKESIYPEFLPDALRRLGPTRREQFLAWMRERQPQVEIIDLQPLLLAAKSADGPDNWLYGKLGTHWTGRGSLVALRALLEWLEREVGGVDPKELATFERVEITDNGDSWSRRMYIGDLLHQAQHACRATIRRAKVLAEGEWREGTIRRTEVADPARPRVLLMHDSFATEVETELAHQCAYLECHWNRSLPMNDIAQAAPDVLVDMFVERTLCFADPWELLPGVEASWATRFQQSKHTLAALERTRSDWGIASVGAAKVGPPLSFPKPRLPVVLHAESDRLALPAFVPVAGEIPVVHLRIDAPRPTVLTLFCAARERSYSRILEGGTNDLYVPLEREASGGELQLKPGNEFGTYMLRDFEIRSVPEL